MPLLALIWVVGALTPVSVHADPQQDFLQIYLLIQEGEKLEADGQAASARARYEDALKRLQQLPEGWEDGIVKYRIKYCREKVAKLKDAKDSNPGATATTSSAVPPESSNAAPIPAPAPPSTDEINKLNAEISALKIELNDTKTQLNTALDEAKDLRAKQSAAQD